MEKQPFTNLGIQALLRTLYKLDDVQLEVQSKQILLDFKIWVAQHFELEVAQVEFMNNLDQRMIALLATDTSAMVNNRLNINLFDERKQRDDDGDKKKKIIRAESKVQADADAEGGYNVSGELNLFIENQPVN